MRRLPLHISLPLLLLVMALLSCDKTPRGVMSVNAMADLIVDLHLADAYIDSHISDYESDSAKLVLKQSIFKKHGITQQDYDSSLVWYAHNMEDYVKAHDKAVGILKARYDKLDMGKDGRQAQDMAGGQLPPGEPTRNPIPGGTLPKPRHKLGSDVGGDTTDLWRGRRSYLLNQGVRRGFITFDMQPDAGKQPGDRYQLAYKLMRGGSEFKVCLNVDYTDGATSQISRATHSDGWITVDVQSDTARQVRRISGYVSYDIKRGHTAFVDSLMLLRTHMNKSNYGLIHGQRLLQRAQ